jgi:thymidylate synthase (FAD)
MKVRVISGHSTWVDEVITWLEEVGLSREAACDYWKSLKDLSCAEIIIILAAKRCYKSFAPGLNPNVTKVRENPKEFIYNILLEKHGSVLEHASATFALEGISRVCTHELVRHRIGVAISQESMRYVALEEFKEILSPELENSSSARYEIEDLLERLKNLLSEIKSEQLVSDASFDYKKKLTSALRRIVPMGVSTGMVWTANFRALRWVLEQRTNPAAEWEIRRLFNAVGDICLTQWPLVFQDFKKVPCEDYPDLFSFVPEFSKV